MRFSLLFTMVTCFLQAQGADKYTDGNRPYEFGFTIDGEQHRYEKKDAKGIIMGEFGFITADGVYHVTVYATDEEGHFKIISMKNIRVKPYPTAPELKYTPSASSFTPPQQSTTTTIKPLLRDFTPLPPSRQEKSCSHCSLPAPKVPQASIAASKGQQSFIPTPPTGPAQQYPSGQPITSQNRNSFPETNNVGNFAPNNNGYSQQGSQKELGLGPNYYKANVNRKLNNPVQVGYNAAGQYPSPGNSPSNFGQSYPNPKTDYKPVVMTGGNNNNQGVNNNPRGANINQNYPETGASVYQNSPDSDTLTNQNYPEPGTRTDQNNSGTNRPLNQNYPRPGTLVGNNYLEQRPSPGENYPAQAQNPEPSSPFSGTLADQNNSGTNGPESHNYLRPGTLTGNNYSEQTPTTGQNYPAQASNPEPNSPFLDNNGPERDSGSNLQNPNTNQQHTLRAPGTRERNPKHYGYSQEPVSTAEQPINSQSLQVPLTSSSSRPVKKPTLISAQMRIVNENTDVHHKNPGETEGLPNGLNKDDMMRILYTFNYTVGFHGHHEEGYSNGAKVGYYYVTGRNGVRTRVDYVADKNGFRPKITQEVLDLLSDEVPKPETEKEEKFGLKSYEFKWLYFPVESKS